MGRSMKLDPYLVPYTKISEKWHLWCGTEIQWYALRDWVSLLVPVFPAAVGKAEMELAGVETKGEYPRAAGVPWKVLLYTHIMCATPHTLYTPCIHHRHTTHPTHRSHMAHPRTHTTYISHTYVHTTSPPSHTRITHIIHTQAPWRSGFIQAWLMYRLTTGECWCDPFKT